VSCVLQEEGELLIDKA